MLCTTAAAVWHSIVFENSLQVSFIFHFAVGGGGGREIDTLAHLWEFTDSKKKWKKRKKKMFCFSVLLLLVPHIFGSWGTYGFLHHIIFVVSFYVRRRFANMWLYGYFLRHKLLKQYGFALHTLLNSTLLHSYGSIIDFYNRSRVFVCLCLILFALPLLCPLTFCCYLFFFSSLC